MANEVSKIKLPNDTTEYPLQDDQAIASITRSGTTFTATRRDGTSFTFTQQDNNTTYTFATGDSNGQIKVTPNGGTAQNVSVKGLGAAAYKGTTTSVTSGSSDLVTSGAVYTAIDNLPEPMLFKGSLGTGGTITTLPTASSANEGYTYKVITAGTYASQPAKVGDLFISNGTDWIWIPSGDEPSGTVTSITLKATSPIAIDSSSAITTSGTRTLSHANSGVTAGTYRSVTVNATGHVTAGTNPTTLSGYGITDAKIANGVITLGSNTITPLTSHQTVTDNNPTLAWGTKSKVATIGSTAINVTMPSNPNTDTKVTAVGNHYTPAEDSTAQLDADASSTTAATWNSTSLVTGITVKRDAKGHVMGIAVDSIKMPANPNTNTTYTIGTSGNNITLTPSSGSAQSITAPYANSTKKLENYYDSRPTDCNLLLGDGSLRTFQATSAMTSNKPPIGDAHIIHLAWDSTNGYDGQIALKNSGAAMMCRAQSSKTWGSWMPIGVFTQATPTTGQVIITDGTVGGIKSSGYTIAKSVPSDAKFTDTNTTYSFESSTDTVSITGSATESNNYLIDLTLTKDNVVAALGYTPPTANTDVNVKVNNTNPTTGTWYYPVWYTGTSGTGNVNANDGFRHYSLQGTASAVGRTILSLGNSTSTGTAGNKRGEIFLYSEKSGRAEIKYDAETTATVTHTFPSTGGTILNTGTTSFTQSLSSGTKIGTIKINGTSTDLYCQTNTNTHRPIQVNGTEILGNNTTALNLKAGSNVSVTNSSGTVTIAATDAKVTQTNTTNNGLYRVLFSESINDTTETEGARKSTKLRFNPSTGQLTLTSLYASGGITAGDGLELGMGSDSAVPFIDFHWNSTDTDYTARLIQRVENTIDFMGKNSGTWGTARAASFSSQSSIFVKENIYSITDDEAKKILQLRPVIFDYKGDGLKDQRGLIAEEVMDVMPEMVIIPKGYTEYDPIEPWNTPCIDYSKFVPYLIKMVQIQQQEIDQLKEQIK